MCCGCGFYFTNAKHILEFLDYGIYLRKVTLPTDDPDFKMVKDKNNKWRVNIIILGTRYNLSDVSTFQYLIDHGIDIYANNKRTIKWASKNRYSKVVEFLISKLIELFISKHIDFIGDYTIISASKNGLLDIVKLLIKHNTDIHAKKDSAIRQASKHGHLDIVKLLIEHGGSY